MEKLHTTTRPTGLTRRNFLKTTGGGLAFTFVLGAGAVAARRLDAFAPAETMLGPWVKIDLDGSVLIYNPAAEMGQGSMTALPVILAEEMDADWSKVRIEHSPIEPNVYGKSWRPGGPGNMMTVGSQAVRGYFMNLRRAGARIRRSLMENAARHWEVPVDELTTEPGMVVHAASGRRLSYGEIAAFAEVPAELPPIDDSQLKSPDEFRLIGHSVPRHDIPSKTDGTAIFAMDVRVPNMVYAMVSRSPVHGGRPSSYNAAEVESLSGIITTMNME